MKSRSESPAPTPVVTQPKITLADIHASLQAMTGKISNLTENQSALNEKVDQIDRRMFEKLEEMSGHVNRIIDTKLEGLRYDLHKEFSCRFNEQDGAISALQTTNAALRDNCRDLSSRVDELSTRATESTSAVADLADRLDFAERESDIIVRGVPVALGENCRSLYERIALALGYSADATPDASAFRLGRKKPGARSDPPILLRFPNRTAKSDFFKRYLGKLTLNLSDIGFDLNTRIFLAESLTVVRQKIFQEAIKLKREGKLYSVKSKAGVIVVQREVNGRAVEIRRLTDL